MICVAYCILVGKLNLSKPSAYSTIGITYWYACTSNPWNAKRVGDISAPLGYTRVEGSYAEFMRQLPLKNQ